MDDSETGGEGFGLCPAFFVLRRRETSHTRQVYAGRAGQREPRFQMLWGPQGIGSGSGSARARHGKTNWKHARIFHKPVVILTAPADAASSVCADTRSGRPLVLLQKLGLNFEAHPNPHYTVAFVIRVTFINFTDFLKNETSFRRLSSLLDVLDPDLTDVFMIMFFIRK